MPSTLKSSANRVHGIGNVSAVNVFGPGPSCSAQALALSTASSCVSPRTSIPAAVPTPTLRQLNKPGLFSGEVSECFSEAVTVYSSVMYQYRTLMHPNVKLKHAGV